MAKESHKKQNKKTAKNTKARNTGLRTGRPPKFDYDREDFYDAIGSLAMQGFTNAGIAWRLADTFGQSLTPSVFSTMVNGKYEAWTEEENKRRGERLSKVLASARDNINSIVRGRFLKAALGGIKIHSKNVVTRKLDIEGEPVDVVQTSENETETAPNIQALSTWLYHHDPEWRKIQKGFEPEEDERRVEKGIDIEQWIERECGLIGTTAEDNQD